MHNIDFIDTHNFKIGYIHIVECTGGGELIPYVAVLVKHAGYKNITGSPLIHKMSVLRC